MYPTKCQSAGLADGGKNNPPRCTSPETKLPLGPSLQKVFYDSPQRTPARSFDVILFQELQRLKQQEEKLRTSLKQKDHPSSSQLLDFKSQLQWLAQKTKVLEIFINHLEKACQSIVANFR